MPNFDVNKYWLDRGQGYIHEERLGAPYHRLQEQLLFEVIERGPLPMGNILELGCGFGRITRLLAEHSPQSKITAVDLSLDQLNNARAYCQGKTNITFSAYDFYSGAPLPGADYDLAMAVEVFLHHPAEVVSGLMARLSRISTFILNVDWSEPWPWNTPEHVWVHDYQRLYQQAGLKSLDFVLPEKIDGKQQKIFVASRELPPSLLVLQQHLNPPDFHAADPPGDWLQQLHHAVIELKTCIPRESLCILVDENHWGDVRDKLHRAMLPFLERDGQYWGPPADDETAIHELNRLRAAGAKYIIFPWHSSWWLRHYTAFGDYLRASFPCIAETDSLTVFKLH